MKHFPALGWFTAALMISSLTACREKPIANEAQAPAPQPVAPKIVSAEPSSFDAIAKHLDAGGGLYFYFSTETLLKAVSDKCGSVVPALMSAGKLDEAQKTKAAAAWESISKVAAKSGLNEVSGFGASSIALEPGYYQTKWMLHHYPEKGNGLIWKLTTSTPNALDFVSYLPEHTAFASSGNLKLTPIWDAVNQEAQSNADLRQGIELVTQQLQQNAGLNLPALLASLGPNYSMVITLDESRPTSFPASPTAQPLTIPEPALAIFIQVQDDVLINRLDEELSKNPMIVKSDEAGLSMRTFTLPIPMPFVRPTIAWKKGLLMIASSDLLIREMLDVQAGKKPGLAATNAEFKKLMTGMPTTGCDFDYVSPLVEKTMHTLQVTQLAQDKTTDPGTKKLLESIYSLAQQRAACSVVQETPEGWVGIRHDAGTTPAK